MCTPVLVIHGPNSLIECHDRGELRQAIGVEPVYEDGFDWEPSDTDCLCSLDGERTASAAGLKCRYATEADYDRYQFGIGLIMEAS